MTDLTVQQVRLADYTTLRVGGEAALCIVQNEVQVQAAAAVSKTLPRPPVFLGSGSNILVIDAGYAGLFIHNQLLGWQYHDETSTTIDVTAGAGVALDTLVADTVARGYWGLENLSAIPGTVGATPVQNVGAYGVEVADVLVSVRACELATGVCRTFTLAECGFGYRDSWFKTPTGQGWYITALTFRLHTVPRPQVSYRDLAQHFGAQVPVRSGEVRTAVMSIRAEKFPDWQTLGTAGSFFKNPSITTAHFTALQKAYPELPGYPQVDGRVKLSLGWVLDKVCQLRGYRVGAVGLSPAQALVLINYGGATATEILSFVQEVTGRVHDATDITIEPEVRIIE